MSFFNKKSKCQKFMASRIPCMVGEEWGGISDTFYLFGERIGEDNKKCILSISGRSKDKASYNCLNKIYKIPPPSENVYY